MSTPPSGPRSTSAAQKPLPIDRDPRFGMLVDAFRAKGYYVMVSQERAGAVARALFLGDHTKDVAVSAPTVEEALQGLAQALGVEARAQGP